MQSGEEAERGLQPWEEEDEDEEQGVNITNLPVEPKAHHINWEISYEEFIAGIGASSRHRFPSSPTKMAREEPDFFETWDGGELPEEDIAAIVEAVRSSSVPWCQDLWDASSLPDSEEEVSFEGESPVEEQVGEPENGEVDMEDWDNTEEDHLAAQRRWTEARHARRRAREAEASKKANSMGGQSQAQGGPTAQRGPKAAMVDTHPLDHYTSSWAPTTNDLAGGRHKLKAQPAISTSPNGITTHRPRRHGRPAVPGLVPTSPELAGALGDLRSVPITQGPTVPRFELPKVQLRKIALTGAVSTTPTTTPPAFNLPRVQLRPVFGRAEGRVLNMGTGSSEAPAFSGRVVSSVRLSIPVMIVVLTSCFNPVFCAKSLWTSHHPTTLPTAPRLASYAVPCAPSTALVPSMGPSDSGIPTPGCRPDDDDYACLSGSGSPPTPARPTS